MPWGRPGLPGMAMTFRESMISCSEPKPSSFGFQWHLNHIHHQSPYTAGCLFPSKTASSTHEMVLLSRLPSTGPGYILYYSWDAIYQKSRWILNYCGWVSVVCLLLNFRMHLQTSQIARQALSCLSSPQELQRERQKALKRKLWVSSLSLCQYGSCGKVYTKCSHLICPEIKIQVRSPTCIKHCTCPHMLGWYVNIH